MALAITRPGRRADTVSAASMRSMWCAAPGHPIGCARRPATTDAASLDDRVAPRHAGAGYALQHHGRATRNSRPRVIRTESTPLRPRAEARGAAESSENNARFHAVLVNEGCPYRCSRSPTDVTGSIRKPRASRASRESTSGASRITVPVRASAAISSVVAMWCCSHPGYRRMARAARNMVAPSPRSCATVASLREKDEVAHRAPPASVPSSRVPLKVCRRQPTGESGPRESHVRRAPYSFPERHVATPGDHPTRPHDDTRCGSPSRRRCRLGAAGVRRRCPPLSRTHQ